MLKNKQIDFFLTVIHASSIRRAAEQLGVEPSTISRQIAALEKEMGSTLIERGRRGVKLTLAGELFYQYLMQNEAQIEQLYAEINAINGLEKGLITLSVGEGFVGDLVRSSLKEFHLKYPQIEFKINFGSTKKIIRQILSDEVHIGIAYNVPTERDIKIISQSKQPLKLVMHQNSPLKTDFDRVGLKALEAFPCALLKQNSAVGSLARLALKEANVQLKPLIETDSIAVIKDFIREDMGFSFLPDFVVGRELDEGHLISFEMPLQKFNQGSAEIFARSGRPLPKIVQLFASHLKAKLHA